MKTSTLNLQKLPLVIEPSESLASCEAFCGWLHERREHFHQELLKYGGLLFRGFPLQGASDFAAAIDHLALGRAVPYVGGDSPRKKIQGAVYTSTEAPPSIKIPLHNELSFVKNYPNHIYFFCEVAPQVDGETILGDARAIYQAVDPSVRERLETKGIKYVSAYYYKSTLMELLNRWQRSHKSWPEVFETDSKEELERACRAHEFGFEWTRKDWVRIEQVRPATLVHPLTGERVWFNQIHLYDFNPRLLGFLRYVGAKIVYAPKHRRLHEVFYADGTPIPREDIYHLLDVLDQNTIRFPWERGDFLVLDNVLAMHGRATFTGPRRILAAMTS